MTKKEMQDRMEFVAKKLNEYADSMTREGIPYAGSIRGLAKVLEEE